MTAINAKNLQESRVGVDQLGHIACLQIPENCSLVEVGHVGHIVELLHLGRVDLHALGRLVGLRLPADLDVDLVSVDCLDHGLVKASFTIRHPDALLGVYRMRRLMAIGIVENPQNLTVGFEGVFLLHLEREDQPVNEVNQENPSKMKQKDLEGESPKSKTTEGDLQWRPKRKEKQPSMLKQESLTMETDQDPAPAFLLS